MRRKELTKTFKKILWLPWFIQRYFSALRVKVSLTREGFCSERVFSCPIIKRPVLLSQWGWRVVWSWGSNELTGSINEKRVACVAECRMSWGIYRVRTNNSNCWLFKWSATAVYFSTAEFSCVPISLADHAQVLSPLPSNSGGQNIAHYTYQLFKWCIPSQFTLRLHRSCDCQLWMNVKYLHI